jgi:hypothetical protein
VVPHWIRFISAFLPAVSPNANLKSNVSGIESLDVYLSL